MDQRHDEFESFLRQFQPRVPRALPRLVAASRFNPRWWRAAAAVGLVGVGTSVLIWRLSPAPVRDREAHAVSNSTFVSAAPTVTVGRLTQVAIAGLDGLDATLTIASRSLLPHVERPDSTLFSLAKD